MHQVATPRDARQRELALLREVIEEHAAIERLAGSEGERRSAMLLHDRLHEIGTPSRIEPATFLEGWARTFAEALAVPIVAGVLGHRRTGRWRVPLALASATAGWLLADDISNGRRPLRRALRRRRDTQNVIAELGPADAPITLVVLAHHDAARTGQMFDQAAQRALWKRFPERIESIKTSLPSWWPAFLAPMAVGLGLLTRRRGMQLGGAGFSAVAAGLLVDIARSPVVPGANDNLSGVAVLVALAERWKREPIEGIRVLLVSAGAEEELQGGVYGFLEDHGAELDPATTRILAVDTVGSPQLVMLEGEGPVRMIDYDRTFRELVADVAEDAGVTMQRGFRSRFSTDGIVPTKRRIPTVSLVSLERWGAPSNYHLMTDTPDTLTYETIQATVDLSEALAKRLASGDLGGPRSAR
ncbi:MAG: M28 family peptidase [Solirubrobacteraceae bacterium]|nr:M28 family peptidase [Solirubrobacteraceae bacterium]